VQAALESIRQANRPAGDQRSQSQRRADEVQHLIHWLFGGETSLENSGLLCERHHTQVHHGFTTERDATGRWRTYRPDGTAVLVIRPPADDPQLARAG
jgi:hypothetical protein